MSLFVVSAVVLTVQVASDALCPLEVTGRRVHRMIPGSQLKLYEKASHGLMISHMDELNRDLFDFIS
jgi:pimeloyl-ACP methyl ester carboxylesterase